MGLQQIWTGIKYSRYANRTQGALLFILEHTEKKCAYCEEKYGIGLGLPVADILNHMKESHPEKVDMKKVNLYLKAFS